MKRSDSIINKKNILLMVFQRQKIVAIQFARNYMKIKNIIVILTIITLLFSCNETPMKISNKQHSESFTRNSFAIATNLKATEKKLPNSKGANCILVISSQNLLIVTESQGDYLCTAYTLDSLKYIRSFIKKGEDSVEQLTAFVLRYNEKNNAIDITDPPKRSIYSYSVNSINDTSKSVNPISILKIDGDRVERAIKLYNGSIVDVSTNKNLNLITRLTFYDSVGNWLKSTGRLPSMVEGFRPYELDEIFMSALTDTPNDSGILISCFSTDIIEKYDQHGNLIKRLHGPDGFEPDSKRIKKGKIEYLGYGKNSKSAFSNASADEKNILISYSGTLQTKSQGAKELLLFDNTLSPLAIYVMDIPIDIFDVDWKNHVVYGISLSKVGSLITYNF